MKSLDVTLRQLEYFVATVERGTLSAAAAEFHVSQTAVSLAISQLEKALGVQVLVRRPAKAPALTAAGRQLLGDARQVLGHVGELESAVRTIGQDISGQLSIGCFPTITPFVMGRILEEVPIRYPELEIDLVEDTVEGLQRRLADGLCDLAIMYDIGLGSDVTTLPLYSCPPYAVLPAGHRFATRRTVALSELIDEPMVMIDMPPSLEFFTGRIAEAGYAPDIRFRTRSVETVRTFVGRGMGWAVLLHRPGTERSYDGSAVASVDLEGMGAPVDVLLVMNSSARMTRRARAFAEMAPEVLRTGPVLAR
ncbi:LysR family transcriptional regulator [Nocardia vinacea]|uniref:LysR family transcriptional regulator n=1 Tax=Nocardia vinacea TaxID=96468 RepID=A0ABZ1YR79_9NOCA|nr:LysR family transcriptional regulator [Nocardia vinacea]